MENILKNVIQDLQPADYSPRTVEAYSYHVKKFLEYFDKDPKTITEIVKLETCPEQSRMNGKVTYKYTDSKSGKVKFITVEAFEFRGCDKLPCNIFVDTILILSHPLNPQISPACAAA